MADNVGYTPGSGATIAADDIGGVLYQRVKLAIGADGSAADAPGDSTDGLKTNVTKLPDLSISAKETDCSSSGNNTAHTPASGKKIRLYYICFSSLATNTAPVTVIAKYTTGGNALFKVSLPVGATWAHHVGAGRNYLEGGVDETLQINLSAAQTVYVSLEYREV